MHQQFFSGKDVSEFGTGGNFLWANVHAIDCPNVGLNEGPEAATTDFKLCFASVSNHFDFIR